MVVCVQLRALRGLGLSWLSNFLETQEEGLTSKCFIEVFFGAGVLYLGHLNTQRKTYGQYSDTLDFSSKIRHESVFFWSKSTCHFPFTFFEYKIAFLMYTMKKYF